MTGEQPEDGNHASEAAVGRKEADGPIDIENVEEGAVEDTELFEPIDTETPPPNRYNISSYGWDSDVEGLVKRLDRGDIFVPGFQRGYVWKPRDKSSFIESLILGLPVPNIFLAQDSKTKSLNIVDGQQRLRTLQAFLHGDFYLSGNDIQPELRGCYFSAEVAKSKNSKVLETSDARTLADSVIHSIVIKPDSIHDDPDLGHEYNAAIIQIFRRLNTTGKPLNDQEIRTSIFYGSFDNMLRELNEDASWRELFGVRHSRLKDMELILRFVSLRESWKEYKSPMPKFLTGFMEANREMDQEKIQEIKSAFAAVTETVEKIFGREVIRSGATLVVSKFDAVMVGIDKYLQKHSEVDEVVLQQRLAELEADPDYIWSTAEFVNDTERVLKRIERAISVLGA